jgi:NAD+ synthase (glutamine-hydrolysing)
VRIALAQLNLLIGDLEGARRGVLQAARQAQEQGAQLLVAPELCLMGGYPPRDLLDRRALVEEQWRMLSQLARELPLPALLGCVEPLTSGPDPRLANAVAAISDGVITATYHKRLLPMYDVFDERRYFRPGLLSRVVVLQGMRIGLTICEDIWNDASFRYEQDPVADLVGRCDLVVNLSASPYHVGKPLVRHQLVAGVASRTGAPTVYCNEVGAHDELLFDGGSCVIAPDGGYRLLAPRWQSGTYIADLDQAVPGPQPIDPTGDLYDGLVMGIRDYCAKTRQRQVVLGLSGGIDSALVATLAVDALGADAVTGLLMPGPYSSPGSIGDAQILARNLGIRSEILNISKANEVVLQELSPIFAGTSSGLAEENLQSRLRGTLVMAVANKLGAMALTTGNKSELAVGYCTIYGDMNGGLGPIGDCYKTQVWDLSRWINRERERIPLASITKAPSAELRENQTDQDSLPPYDQLDRILERFLERGQTPQEIVDSGEPVEVVRRIVRLVEVNEFKRRQAAPTLRVTPKAFGSGRRMPIARHIS